MSRGRHVNLDRFGGAEPEDAEYSGHVCDYCETYVFLGEEVRTTYDNEIVHDGCWRDYCDETYCADKGIAVVGGVE